MQYNMYGISNVADKKTFFGGEFRILYCEGRIDVLFILYRGTGVKENL